GLGAVGARGGGAQPAHGLAGGGAGGDQLLDRGSGVGGQQRHLLGHRIGGAGVLGQASADSPRRGAESRSYGYLAAEDDVDPRQHELELRPGQLADPFGEVDLVQGHHLGDVGDGLPGESRRPGGSRTFPGAPAHFRLLVRATQTTVAIRLRFSASPWTTTTGRRNPGAEPLPSGTSAHQTSPWAIVTSRCASGRDGTPRARTGRSARRSPPGLGPSRRRPDPGQGAPGTRRGPGYTPRFASAPSAARAARPPRTRHREQRRQLSYPEYNPACGNAGGERRVGSLSAEDLPVC